ncbi:helix-turn-helix domain-containing protein [Subtercola sp. RTI3]|uniref:helix-turn-helix domain-containing protein n=1 Tax=Subtercola sp. RTI3 TaxID=3048639 RepID=UPI002B23885D|nr:helix-turn-helix domain-containing protein [Subtercola sp. RTI3]MEA9983694.1 helix-turn-helix domain-containing protein [Subtercola sp. RTI3]
MIELRDVSSIAEAAAYLQVTEAAIRRMARSKQIGSLKIGRVVTIPRAAIEAYIETHTVAANVNPWGLTDASLANLRDGRSSRTKRVAS